MHEAGSRRPGRPRAGGGPRGPKAGCPPLRVAIDGKEVTNLRGLAVTLKNGEYETEQVELYDSAAIACAEVLAPNMTLPAGSVALRAYYHPEAQGLGTEAYTELGVRGITLVGKGPSTTLCVPSGTTFSPNSGVLAGKKVEVSGSLTGAHCGVKDMNAH